MLTVEDGTGLPNSDSYIALADASTYVSSYYLAGDPQTTLWNTALVSTDAEVALRRASRDIDAEYGKAFLSVPLTTTQSLSFPRKGITPGVPIELTSATVEMALLILGGTDIIGPDDRSGGAKEELTKIGTLEFMTEYFAPSDIPTNEARKVEMILGPLLNGYGSVSIQLVRG